MQCTLRGGLQPPWAHLSLGVQRCSKELTVLEVAELSPCLVGLLLESPLSAGIPHKRRWGC